MARSFGVVLRPPYRKRREIPLPPSAPASLHLPLRAHRMDLYVHEGWEAVADRHPRGREATSNVGRRPVRGRCSHVPRTNTLAEARAKSRTEEFTLLPRTSSGNYGGGKPRSQDTQDQKPGAPRRARRARYPTHCPAACGRSKVLRSQGRRGAPKHTSPR